ncbi:MAG TPA: hypothetical protein VMP03_10930 [Methylomirabilota bacterium]|nr:hypothetical protein [Methylomirabilota bacterium]
MQGILYEETSLLSFVLVTVIMGGGTAWMTGRACAVTWRPLYVLIFYLLILGVGVRFIHFSVFESTLFSLQYYAVDAIYCIIIGVLGFRFTRANQMVRQYYWIYEKAGPINWKPRG